jgi:hypothetical protein
MVPRALLVIALMCVAPADARQAPAEDPIATLVARLEQAGAAGDPSAVVALGTSPEASGVKVFASASALPPSRFIIKERDRAPLTASTDRLLLEVFAQYGNEAVITTWRVDVTSDPAPPGERRIQSMEQLSVVSGLHRLALNPAKQFDVRNLTIRGTDLTLELPSGQAFMAETADGPTAVVLLGRGRMQFAPTEPAERTQIRIFSGDESLGSEFTAAFIRVRPGDFSDTFGTSAFVPRAVHAGDFRRASEVFDDHVGQTLQLDLTDLSRERWSLIPSAGDLIAEVRTRRHGSLTYTRSSKDAEDISLFDRRRRRNLAVYASAEKLASRGRFYSEDQSAEYDVQRYDVDVAFSPERLWIDGNVQMTLKVRAYILTSVTLRLAEPLVVRSITSPQLGRLLHLRVVGQNSVIVNLPATVSRDTELTLNVIYGGRLEPQQVEQEALAVQAPQQQAEVEQAVIPIEPQYVYSNRSYWYPQATVTDYALARLRVSVPAEFDVVASGTQMDPPAITSSTSEGAKGRKLVVFDAERPVRYLACLITRLNPVVVREVPLPLGARGITVSPGVRNGATERGRGGLAPVGYADSGILPQERDADRRLGLTLSVQANPRQTGRARSLADRSESILQYFTGLIGGAPYGSFTLAVAENELPGGHSPAYFAVLNHPPPTIPLLWRNDPVVFDGYPHFFLAHEIAHQWWGHAVGWKNYHEQWLSEGFAQYFAALYAERDRGDDVFTGILRQMRRWSLQQSAQGPVYLGYRLGHIKGDGRVFRALVYNKGAMVLHMLRRTLGDEAFFAGIRRFYSDWRFRKAGTNDFRLAMESASGRELSAFFEGWIYGSAVPRLKFTTSATGGDLLIRFEHQGEIVPVPVTVSVTYTDGRSEELVVQVTEKIVEQALRLNGTPRSIDANRDHAAVAEIDG